MKLSGTMPLMKAATPCSPPSPAGASPPELFRPPAPFPTPKTFAATRPSSNARVDTTSK